MLKGCRGRFNESLADAVLLDRDAAEDECPVDVLLRLACAARLVSDSPCSIDCSAYNTCQSLFPCALLHNHIR